MKDLVRVMTGCAESLTDNLGRAAATLARRHSGKPLNRVATRAQDEDARGAVFVGRSRFGFRKTFTSVDVLSVPLKDASGNLVGVAFPSKRRDVEDVTAWARADYPLGNRRFSVGKPVSGTDSETGRPFIHFDTKRAPWDEEEGGRAPAIFFAHFFGGKAQVMVKGKRLSIDPGTFGEILAENKDFVRRVNENRGGSSVALLCRLGSGAEEVAEALWRSGLDTKVHAFKPNVGLRLHHLEGGKTVAETVAAPTNRAERKSLEDSIVSYEPPRPFGNESG
ncbi:MAG: hypothetical protein HOQ36_15915 [Nocardia sp.]|nr:hypothetical protein [Nocardia sp.]